MLTRHQDNYKHDALSPKPDRSCQVRRSRNCIRRSFTTPTLTFSVTTVRLVSTIAVLPSVRPLPPKRLSVLTMASDVMFNTILTRLPGNHTLKDRDQISWALPLCNNELRTFELCEKLLSEPLLCSDAEMLELLPEFLLSTRESAAPSPGTTIFYVRSFCLSVAEMLSFIETLPEWIRRRQLFKDWLQLLWKLPSTQKIYLRYGGQSTKKPWTRHQEDSQKRRIDGNGERTSVTIAFYKFILQQQPHIFDAARIYEIIGARTSTSDHMKTTLHEQVVIAMLKLGVLNSQVGGTGLHHSFKPDNETFFFKMDTDVMRSI